MNARPPKSAATAAQFDRLIREAYPSAAGSDRHPSPRITPLSVSITARCPPRQFPVVGRSLEFPGRDPVAVGLMAVGLMDLPERSSSRRDSLLPLAASPGRARRTGGRCDGTVCPPLRPWRVQPTTVVPLPPLERGRLWRRAPGRRRWQGYVRVVTCPFAPIVVVPHIGCGRLRAMAEPGIANRAAARSDTAIRCFMLRLLPTAPSTNRSPG